MDQQNQKIQNVKNIIPIFLMTILVAVISSFLTVLVMTRNNSNTNTPETYLTESEPATILQLMEDNVRGVRNAGEDLGELKNSIDKPVVDISQYLPK